jgi:hypothetical protein
LNLYAFVASLVSSLAWPVLVGIILLLLVRRSENLADLIQTVRKYVKTVKVGSIELTLQDARQDAEAIAVERGEPLATEVPANDKLMQLAQLDPALAVVDIWKELEAEIIKLIQHNGMMRFTSPVHFMKALADQKKITKSELMLYNHLRKIRNEAVHSRDPMALTLAEVLEYRSLVSALIERFEKIRASPEYINLP